MHHQVFLKDTQVFNSILYREYSLAPVQKHADIKEIAKKWNRVKEQIARKHISIIY